LFDDILNTIRESRCSSLHYTFVEVSAVPYRQRFHFHST